jgi:PAS domain S-box-containing protein
MQLEDRKLCFWAENKDISNALRRRTAVWLRTVLRASALVLVSAVVAGMATRSEPIWWIYASFALVLGAAFVLDGSERTREAGVVLSFGFWAVATAAVFFLGGVRSPGSFVYLPVVITAGLFWSWRAAGALTAASLATVLLAAWLEQYNFLPLPLRAPTVARLLPIFAGSLTMTAVLLGIAVCTLNGALEDLNQHVIRTEELLTNVPDVLAVIDRLGVVVAVSPAMRERTGYEPNELLGKDVSRIELFGQERPAVADDVRLLGSRGVDGARVLALRCRDGALAWGEVRLQALPLSRGGTLRRIVLYDVTRRHVAEARQAEFERRVEQSRRLERMGLLAGGVAHDFNNQLTVILSLGSVLDTRLPPDSPERRLLTEINQSAVRAAELARDLLSVKPTKQAEIIDLGRELAAFEPMLSRMAGLGMSLSVRMHGGPCFARIERADLERIATNLVLNARDAMPNGGEIEVAIAPAADGEGTYPPRRMVELTVSDSGVGMDSLTRQRILEPFYTTKGALGTGLGLSTVDGIVARAGGRILVESERGRGTKLRILLPEAESDGVNS